MAPGPLLFLVISETIKGDKVNGILIALSPILTDLPIIIATVYGLKAIGDVQTILGILSIIGALFLVYIGVQNLRLVQPASIDNRNYNNSLKRGVITNLLSPHPYIFWITIGAPTFIKASAQSGSAPYLFVAGFYLLLVGSKIGVALLTTSAKDFLHSKMYMLIIKLSGIIIIILAVFMGIEGLSYL